MISLDLLVIAKGTYKSVKEVYWPRVKEVFFERLDLSFAVLEVYDYDIVELIDHCIFSF